MYGTYGAFKHRVPGMFKIRYVGQSTVQTGLVRAAGCSALPINTHLHARMQAHPAAAPPETMHALRCHIARRHLACF
jgi:hypothetical protein